MPRRFHHPAGLSRWAPALLALLVTACAGASIVAPMAVNVCKNLLGVAQENHDSKYQEVLLRVMESMAGNVNQTSSVTAVGMTAGMRTAPPPEPEEPAAPEPEEPAEEPLAPLALEFDLFQEVVVNGQSRLLPIENGSILKDGRGDPNAGDNFKILVTPQVDCHLYVITADATGWLQPLYPIGLVEGSNPVRADQSLEIPGGANWFYLDENRGKETVYVAAFREANLELEAALKDLAALKRPAATGPARMENPDVVTRGVLVRPGTDLARGGASRPLQDTRGQTTQVDVSAFVADLRSQTLVLTRWFDHQ